MIATHDISHDSDQHTASARGSHDTDAPTASPDTISPMQRWAHILVVEMLNANLPLPALAEHLGIPFQTLIDYINFPEVRAEIEAYEELCALRARLLGQTARPISLRRLLDVLQYPAPVPTRMDRPEEFQRTLHRHAELIRRTATTIAKESRAVLGRSALRADAKSPSQSPRAHSDGTSSGRGTVRSEPELVHDTPAPPPTPAPSPSSPQGASNNLGAADFSPRGSSSAPSSAPSNTEPTPAPVSSDEPINRVACLGEDQACSEDLTPSPTPEVSHVCAVGGADMPPETNAPLSPNAHSPSPSSPDSSDLPSRTVYPAGALPDLPHAASLQNDANSPRDHPAA
ncbi:MAG: hypothetical protein KF902_01850 [Phycisphaeraceae bacterium]|nr:hypothetical protein [Phycisphaeraceae bacterium]MCW5769910.1 hypothetical protein [Phycisphaeraceae bacterium]